MTGERLYDYLVRTGAICDEDVRYEGLTRLYRYYDADGKLLYLGITGQFSGRHEQHITKVWASDAKFLRLERFPDRYMAEVAEHVAIINESPVHNLQLRKTAGRWPDRAKWYSDMMNGEIRGECAAWFEIGPHWQVGPRCDVPAWAPATRPTPTEGEAG